MGMNSEMTECSTIISHLKEGENGWEIQCNEEHATGVAAMAERFASSFDCGEFGRLMGLLHDKGKEQAAFQQYIRRESGYMPEIPFTPRTPHAYVGALLAELRLGHALGMALSWPIMGHHAGLHDWADYDETIRGRAIPEGITDLNINPKRLTDNLRKFSGREMQPKDMNHWLRMLYSCLVDADFLDTEAFMSPDESKKRGRLTNMSELKFKLDGYLKAHFSAVPETPVNKIRAEIQRYCLKESQEPTGFFGLTVPTGGGKTISSIVWAVNHAIKNGKKRIIIAIPYTSIIVQTASTLREIFGDENVLEHHSEVDESSEGNELCSVHALASENWDYPIVVTTNVRLFESMFSNKPSKCRRLHNICDSVLILDEIQTLPVGFMNPIINALSTYNRIFGVSVLFTTASMPVLNEDFHFTNGAHLESVGDIHEIVPAEMNLSEKMVRVNLNFDNEPSTYDEIASRLCGHNRVLCVVNTRQDAKEIYERLPDEGLKVHLSRMMCPAHVSKVISQIKEALSDPNQKIIRVVSTQLIEAGVDIDFPTVFRQEIGLDSVLQAAGRCNREGRLQSNGEVYVFSLSDRRPRGTMLKANEARRSLPCESNWFSEETMRAYFSDLYFRLGNFDEKDIASLLRFSPDARDDHFKFKEAALRFKLIEDDGVKAIVNYGEAADLVQQYKLFGSSYSLMKKLGRYTVTVHRYDEDALAHIAEEIGENLYYVEDKKQYGDTGLSLEGRWAEETLII